MARFVWTALVASAIGACGTNVDDRSLDAQFVTVAILAPACGQAECHSTFVQKKTDVFDTVVGMRESVIKNHLVTIDSTEFDPLIPDSAPLILWLTKNDPLGKGIGRMPLDAPMPFEDISLLEEWIRGVPSVRQGTTCTTDSDCTTLGDHCHIPLGSTAGQCVVYENPARGAQCDPRPKGFTHGQACINDKLYGCGPDWNATALIQQCPNGCTQGACL